MPPHVKQKLETAGQLVTIVGSIATIGVGVVTYFVSTNRAQAIAEERAGWHQQRLSDVEQLQSKDHDSLAELKADVREIKTDVKHILNTIDRIN